MDCRLDKYERGTTCRARPTHLVLSVTFTLDILTTMLCVLWEKKLNITTVRSWIISLRYHYRWLQADSSLYETWQVVAYAISTRSGICSSRQIIVRETADYFLLIVQWIQWFSSWINTHMHNAAFVWRLKIRPFATPCKKLMDKE